MRNSEILNIPFEEIDETLETEPQIIHKSEVGTCLAFLKNFDYYHIFCVINPDNRLVNQYIKLPTSFVEKNNKSYLELLKKFLEITGVPFGSHNNDFIVTLEGENKQIWMHPDTYNRTKYMIFGLEKENIIEFMFSIDIIKYRDFLEDYQVKGHE